MKTLMTLELKLSVHSNEVRSEPSSGTTGDVTNDHTDPHAATTDVVPGVNVTAESIYETMSVATNKPHVSFQSIGNPTAKIVARQLKPKVTSGQPKPR